VSDEYHSRVVAHGTVGARFDSERVASRSSSTLRATTGTPATEHSAEQLRVAIDTSHQAKWRLRHDPNRLFESFCHHQR